MMNRIKGLFGVGLTILLFLIAPLPVIAAPLLTQVGGNPVTVTEGNQVENILAIGTDVRIGGAVNDVVFVINGNVDLEATAQVDLVIDLGGSVQNSARKYPENGILEFNFTRVVFNNLMIGGVMVIGFWLLRLMLSLLAILALTGAGFILEKRLMDRDKPEKFLDLLSSSGLRLLGIGTLASVVILAFIIILSISMIGVPLAVFITIVSAIAMILGMIPVMEYLGKKVLAEQFLQSSLLTRLLVESILFVAMANLPLIGSVFLLGTGLTGLGVVMVQIGVYFEKRKKKVKGRA